jgi:hypothetical protein
MQPRWAFSWIGRVSIALKDTLLDDIYPNEKYIAQHLKLPRFFSFQIELIAFLTVTMGVCYRSHTRELPSKLAAFEASPSIHPSIHPSINPYFRKVCHAIHMQRWQQGEHIRGLHGRDPPANGQQGFRIRDPYLSSNTTIDRLVQPASLRNQSLHLYLKLEQRRLGLLMVSRIKLGSLA